MQSTAIEYCTAALSAHTHRSIHVDTWATIKASQLLLCLQRRVVHARRLRRSSRSAQSIPQRSRLIKCDRPASNSHHVAVLPRLHVLQPERRRKEADCQAGICDTIDNTQLRKVTTGYGRTLEVNVSPDPDGTERCYLAHEPPNVKQLTKDGAKVRDTHDCVSHAETTASGTLLLPRQARLCVGLCAGRDWLAEAVTGGILRNVRRLLVSAFFECCASTRYYMHHRCRFCLFAARPHVTHTSLPHSLTQRSRLISLILLAL